MGHKRTLSAELLDDLIGSVQHAVSLADIRFPRKADICDGL